MQRCVEPELLDELPPDDPRAVESRRDLRRVNRLMAHPRIVAREIKAGCPTLSPRRVVDLGGGDGTLLLKMAKQLPVGGEPTEAIIVDRQNLLDGQTRGEFQRLGWETRASVTDVFDWLENASFGMSDVMVANLFLHHFDSQTLEKMFRLAAAHTRLFISCDPRRSQPILLLSRLLWLVGCNEVTRHDAVVSVRAGFANADLSVLWPKTGDWRLKERRAGLFSHLFAAQRRDEPNK